MFKCNKCNKTFKYESKLKEHKNKKIPCDKTKEEIKCELCNLTFERPNHKIKHEKTEKHKYNLLIINKEEDNEININVKLDKLTNQNIDLNNKINELTNKLLEYNNKIKNLDIINKDLLFENSNLKKSNQKLKNNNKIHQNKEYIYIIHPIQYINTNIYKIGRTNNIMRRINEYPKGSEILFSSMCKNSKKIESDIIQFLKNNIENVYYCKDIGNEYFQCEFNFLKNNIENIIRTYDRNDECTLNNGFLPDIINSEF
jgi:hypothetical protein